MRQISHIFTTTMPNQIGLYPSATTAGYTIGKVRSSMPIVGPGSRGPGEAWQT